MRRKTPHGLEAEALVQSHTGVVGQSDTGAGDPQPLAGEQRHQPAVEGTSHPLTAPPLAHVDRRGMEIIATAVEFLDRPRQDTGSPEEQPREPIAA
jgi:hypothetical protein